MTLPTISRSELAVLKTLWRKGPSTVREVWGDLPDDKWVYTTVQTLLQRLEAKGFAESTKRERLRVYGAAVTRDELVEGRLGELSRDLCDGSSVPLLQGLVSGQGLSAEEIAGLRQLLDDMEEGLKPNGRRANRPRRPRHGNPSR